MHGGGWLRGDRSMVSPQFASWRPGPLARLAADGFAVASVDYRLSGEARFPAQLEDVSAAVDWLTGQAAEYGFDPSRIVLWGESAGAHLAALLGLQSTGSRVRGVVDWYGPADLLALDEQVGAAGALTDDPLDSREARLLGAPVAAVPELARAASPIGHVRAGAPPFLIAHGTADRLVPFSAERGAGGGPGRGGSRRPLRGGRGGRSHVGRRRRPDPALRRRGRVRARGHRRLGPGRPVNPPPADTARPREVSCLCEYASSADLSS